MKHLTLFYLNKKADGPAPPLKNTEALAKLFQYGAVGTLPGLAYSLATKTKAEKDENGKLKPVTNKDKVLRALQNMGISGAATAGGSLLADDDLRFKYISPIVGQVVSNIARPYSYDLKSKIKAFNEHPWEFIKGVVNDEPAYVQYNQENPNTAKDIQIRRALTRLGFGMDLDKPLPEGIKRLANGNYGFDDATETGKRLSTETVKLLQDEIVQDIPGETVGADTHSILGGIAARPDVRTKPAVGTLADYTVKDPFDFGYNDGSKFKQEFKQYPAQTLIRTIASKFMRPVTVEQHLKLDPYGVSSPTNS